jgi:flagellar motor switch protein FliM
MDKILSQEEVDALLKGISSGEVATAADEQARQQGVEPYDLTKLDRIVVGKIPAIEVLADRFTRMMRKTLSGALRKMLDVNVIASEVKRFGDFLKVLPFPTSIHLFRITPQMANGLLVVEANLVYVFVEIFTGGSGESKVKIEGRDFTPIEMRLIGNVVRGTLADLERAWNVLEPVKLKYERAEIHPQFAMVMQPSDLVLCIHVEVELDVATGAMIICLPYSVVEPYKERIPGEYEQGRWWQRPWVHSILEHLYQTPVEISVELGCSLLPVKKLLSLREGDFVGLDRSVGDLLKVKIEGVPKYWSSPGFVKGKRAVRISGAIPTSSDEELPRKGLDTGGEDAGRIQGERSKAGP